MALFQKGDQWTGNRNGRPKKPPTPPPLSIKDLAREASPDAIRLMAEVMRDPANPLKDRMFAANTILDRGYGKPQQVIEATLSTFERMTEAQLLEFLTGQPVIEGEMVDVTPDEGAAESGPADEEPDDA